MNNQMSDTVSGDSLIFTVFYL